MGFLAISVFFGPAFDVLLLSTSNTQSVFWYFLGDGAACADIGVGLNSYGRYQIGVAAHKGIVADDGAMLFLAIVVNSDAAAAHVNAAADIAVANVGEVGQLSAFAHIGVLNFHIVTNLYMVADNSVGTQMYVGTGGYVVFNLTVMGINELQMVIVANLHIGEAGIGTDFAVLTDFGAAFQPSVGVNNGVAANFYTALDKGAGRVHNSKAAIHQLI